MCLQRLRAGGAGGAESSGGGGGAGGGGGGGAGGGGGGNVVNVCLGRHMLQSSPVDFAAVHATRKSNQIKHSLAHGIFAQRMQRRVLPRHLLRHRPSLHVVHDHEHLHDMSASDKQTHWQLKLRRRW